VSTKIDHSDDFREWASFIAEKIRRAHVRAAIKVNEELIQLYWEIGSSILEQQKAKGWGGKVIGQLAAGLEKAFPEASGFSLRNLKYMRAFAEAYPDFPNVQVPIAQSADEFVQVPLAQIPWYHHISLLTAVKDPEERAFYIIEAARNNWSRNVMMLQVKSGLYGRSGKAVNNFSLTLPEHQSDLARDIFKDPYHFGFLSLTSRIKEQEMEKRLIEKIADFLLELGKGFAFVGRQYPIEVDGTDYRIDLLFYHTALHAYVVIELKTGEFMPEYVSKLNFYISAVDDSLRSTLDQPTIGLLLCASKSNVKVEYAMRGLEKPLGVAAYELEQLMKESLQNDDAQETIADE